MKLFLILMFCQLQILWSKMDRTWWKYTTMYEVNLPSFKDGNGDGTGDLKGLISKLDHFVDIGVETVYISPHYESPMYDSGYDVTNYTSINPSMGTIEDFETLVKEMNSKGLKLIIDIILNHCSDEHPWFIKSVNKEDPYTNFFVWKEPKGYDAKGSPLPPNNWLNVFGGSAWSWNNQRNQFYYHQFSPKQPDYNLRNKAVETEIKKILAYWLNKGVAGFRLDAVPQLLEDALFRDEPVASPDIKVPFKYLDLIHIYTKDHPDTYTFLSKLRRFVNRFAKKWTDFERVLIVEGYSKLEKLIEYYGTEKHKIIHVPLNLHPARVVNHENASFYHNIITDYLNRLPEWATPSWNIENHDTFRKSYVLHEEFEFIGALLVMMLPGFAYIYYGQEIGATGSKIRSDQILNKIDDFFTQGKRDFSKLPMAWDDSLNAGFSTNRDLYLPVSPNYWRINVEDQKNDENSYYHMFKKMSNLRKTNIFKYGDFKSYVLSTWVYAFVRTFRNESYIVIFNFGSESEFIDLHNAIDNLPEFSTIEIASPNSGYKVGDVMPTKQRIPKILILRPSAALVLKT
ncbi:alpha-glucosidase-like [Planococcus citri]|uniref:alpha-glucosidase-like n=1 Tax=Planococcus citri TaxID=170843 RepID=UPI0031F76625